MRFHKVDDNHVVFSCPGCGNNHMIPVTDGHPWTWNGSLDSPTLTPSILARSGHYAPGHQPDDSCWCTYNKAHSEDPAPFHCGICHSFVTEGKIQFLSDCTHALSGQTVDIPEWEV